MGQTRDEVEKLVKVWQNQKDNNLKEARICDAYIEAFGAVLQLLDQEAGKKKKTDSS